MEEQVVVIGEVKAFPNAKADKEQALKVLEEAAEVFGAWQRHNLTNNESYTRNTLLMEIADVIQACVNLASALDEFDLTYDMKCCELRNRKRGRYDAN